METLERIVELERELAPLLDQNYNGLTPETGERCTELVLEYVTMTDSVSGCDIFFIKGLTKVASHIRKAAPDKTGGFEEKIYQFNLEGVEKLRRDPIGPGQTWRINLEAHLLGHASSAAVAMFKKTKEVVWGAQGYRLMIESSHMTIAHDKKYAGYQYSFAAEISELLFKQTEEVEWGEAAYDCGIKAVEILESIDLGRTTTCLDIMACTAKKMYKKTNDITWVERRFETKKKSGELWLKSSQTYAARRYNSAGKCARTLFDATGEIKWAQNAYKCNKKAAEILETIDSRQSAYCYKYAGDAAKNLYVRTGKCSWKENALKCYQAFLDYATENHHEDATNIIKRVREEMDFVTSFTPTEKRK
ncbi:hypothetical protein J4457_03160 [Candidatus Woesearchaeota archaeon]|nr:hypothetical protein [Candidatus Woesearchaeota archaeon]